MHTPIQESDQYSPRSIRRYESIFGADFVSSGGPETTTTICESLDIRPGTRVLDVGSGLGGSAFYMNRAYGAVVTGVDILPQMVALSAQRAAERNIEGVTFIEGDILDMQLPEASFDLVYSRDAFLYIKDKLALFRTLHRLLAPGGRLFVSDYACGPGPLSDEFVNYANGAGYFLEVPAAYGAVVEGAGFKEVQVQDMTDTFIAVLQREVAGIRQGAGEPGDDLDQEDRDYLAERWERKIRWCSDGDMRWAHFRALRHRTLQG
jgi:phosphoethanolamine N-methyltransferase